MEELLKGTSKHEKVLFLDSSNIIKIEGLDKFTDLRKLWLNNNQIIKIENLDKFIHLEWLSLSHTYIFKLNLFDTKNILIYLKETLI
jgi:Leucine-rich repeat (LRR) protein